MINYKGLTEDIIRDLEDKQKIKFSRCVFIASGSDEIKRVERNERKIKRLKKRILGRDWDFKLGDNLQESQWDYLEKISHFFQKQKIKDINEFRPQQVLDSLLSYRNESKGDTLSLVTILNMIAEDLNIGPMGAYKCVIEGEDYYFSRYKGHYETFEGMSLPVRLLDTEIHKRYMANKTSISNKDLIAEIALKTAEFYKKNNKNTRGDRLIKYAKFFKNLKKEVF